MLPLKEYWQCRVSSLEFSLCYIEILSDVYGKSRTHGGNEASSCYQGGAPVVCDHFQVECLFLTRSQKTFHNHKLRRANASFVHTLILSRSRL